MGEVFFFASIVTVAFWGFLSVASWSESRRKEREAYYRSETLRRFSEGSQQEMLARYLEEEKAARHEKRVQQRESLRLGGLVTMMTGIGFGIMLAGIEPEAKTYLFGFIPFLVGLAVLVYVYFMAPKISAGD